MWFLLFLSFHIYMFSFGSFADVRISFTSAITASSTSLRWSSSLALCSAFRFATASVTDAKLLGAVAAGNEWRWAVKLLEMEAGKMPPFPHSTMVNLVAS